MIVHNFPPSPKAADQLRYYLRMYADTGMCRRKLPDDQVALIVEVFRMLRCDGMARVDFFYEAGGRGFLCNEVNTIPGFTPISMYPKLWIASGMTYPALIDELVRLAIERHGRRRRNTKH